MKFLGLFVLIFFLIFGLSSAWSFLGLFDTEDQNQTGYDLENNDNELLKLSDGDRYHYQIPTKDEKNEQIGDIESDLLSNEVRQIMNFRAEQNRIFENIQAYERGEIIFDDLSGEARDIVKLLADQNKTREEMQAYERGDLDFEELSKDAQEIVTERDQQDRIFNEIQDYNQGKIFFNELSIEAQEIIHVRDEQNERIEKMLENFQKNIHTRW